MCKCTPNIRTPWCGKPGCEAPVYTPAKDEKESFDADIRVWKLLDVICAEFESDPMSRQCFDSRIVDKAISLVKARKRMRDPYNPFRP